MFFHSYVLACTIRLRRCAPGILVLFLLASRNVCICAFSQNIPSYTVKVVQNNACAAGINNSDAIVGTTTGSLPYLWTSSGGIQILDITGYTSGTARRISNTGYICGVLSITGSNPQQVCVRWRQGEARQLIVPPEGGTQAYDINDSGQVLALYLSSNPNVYLSVWTPGSGVVDLPGTLDAAAWAAAINDNGVVAAREYVTYTFPYYQAATWSQQSGITVIPNTYPIAGTSGPPICFAENNNGQIVGSSCSSYGQTPCDAFFYDPVQGVTNIGQGIAHAINAGGQVVGGSANDVYPEANWQLGAAWYWTPSTGMIDLNTRIASGTGLILDSAWGINDAGDIVTDAHYVNTSSPNVVVLLRPNVQLSSASVKPNPLPGSLSAIGKVSLKYPVLVDTPVTITNTNPDATVPTSVTIPALANSATFPVNTSAVAVSVSGTLTATAIGPSGKQVRNTTLTVRPIGVKSVKLSASSVQSGKSVSGTVTLEAAAAPGPITVSFVSSNPAVAPDPASITIPAGVQSGTFTITTIVGSSGTTTIQATANGISKRSGTLAVAP